VVFAHRGFVNLRAFALQLPPAQSCAALIRG
jgi:hypothetical protein